MPQKVAYNSGEVNVGARSKSHQHHHTTNDVKLYKSIHSSEMAEHATDTRFLNELCEELAKLSYDVQNGYEAIMHKFDQLLYEMKSRSNRTSDSSSVMTDGEMTEANSERGNSPKKHKNAEKKDKFEA